METATLTPPVMFVRYSLDELRALKAEWLATGQALFRDFALVIWECGRPVEIRTRQYIEFQEGNLLARYSRNAGSYLPQAGRFSLTEKLTAWVVADQVCCLVVSDDPTETTENNFLSLGNGWIDYSPVSPRSRKSLNTGRSTNRNANGWRSSGAC